MYYTPETLLNHVFEDLRKTKAPNNIDEKFSVITSVDLPKKEESLKTKWVIEAREMTSRRQHFFYL
jgi:hypothetical protein